MQIGTEQLKRQQQILQLKGLYNGQLDGIWGPKTIEAMKKWEAKGFAPGLPQNGMPLANKGPWPKGIRKGSDGLLTCAEFEQYLATQAGKKKGQAQAIEEQPKTEAAGTGTDTKGS